MDKLENLNSSLKDVTRITVVDHEGRSYEQMDLYDLEYSIQDDGKTLKLFAKKANVRH